MQEWGRGASNAVSRLRSCPWFCSVGSFSRLSNIPLQVQTTCALSTHSWQLSGGASTFCPFKSKAAYECEGTNICSVPTVDYFGDMQDHIVSLCFISDTRQLFSTWAGQSQFRQACTRLPQPRATQWLRAKCREQPG